MYNSRKHRPFKNRKDAGEQLGNFLKPKYKDLNPLIIGIPRGGIAVGYYVAHILEAELSFIVSKKLPLPGREETGFGAVSENSEIYVSAFGRRMLDQDVIEDIIEKQLVEVQRRVDLYRGSNPLPEMKDRTVIITDDGIAMGVTLVPVIRLCRRKRAGRIIIASPVSGSNYDIHLKEADVIEVLLQPDNFYGVGQVYDQFEDFTDEKVLELIKPGLK